MEVASECKVAAVGAIRKVNKDEGEFGRFQRASEAEDARSVTASQLSLVQSSSSSRIRLSERHSMALFSYGGSSKAQPAGPHGKTEFEILKESHKFLRDENEAEDKNNMLSWEEKLASKYYSNLYREFAVCDLKHYKSGNFALRWRTEDEVLSGTGEMACGNTRCKHYDRMSAKFQGKKPVLTTLELPFAYMEHGEAKSALVKVVLCEKCLEKLMWKRRHGQDSRESKPEIKQQQDAQDELKEGQDDERRRSSGSRSRGARMDRWDRERDIDWEALYSKRRSRSRSPSRPRILNYTGEVRFPNDQFTIIPLANQVCPRGLLRLKDASSLARLSLSSQTPNPTSLHHIVFPFRNRFTQTRDLFSAALVSPGQPERYDWRLQATSRPRCPRPDIKVGETTIVKRVKVPPTTLSEGEPYYASLEKYKSHFLPLLEYEQNEEESVIRQRLSTWSLSKLKDEGFTLTGLSAYWLEGTRYGKPMASFSLGPGMHLPEHKFANGTRVLLSRIDPLKEPPARGSILASTPTHLTISFPDRNFSLDLSDDDSSGWRLDLTESDYIFQLMRSSIDSFSSDVPSQEAAGVFLPPPGSEGQNRSQREREYILNGTCLGDVLLRSFEPSEHPHAHRALQDPDDTSYVSKDVLEHEYHPDLLSLPTGGFKLETGNNHGVFYDNMLIRSWASRYSRPNPAIIEGDPQFEELDQMNDTQKRAMAMMLDERISLVQGPPGTGKTRTIVATVKLLKMFFQVPHPLLVCTYTNVAVDNLVEGLAKAGLKPLRAASAGKTKASLVHWTLEDQFMKHPRYPEWKELEIRGEKLTESIKDVGKKIRKLEGKQTKDGLTEREQIIKSRMAEDLARKKRNLGAVKQRAYGLEQEMTRQIVENADVICTTCITSASAALNTIDFPVVFLDEASMSTEPASLIPLMKGSRHVALIGDHKQLPPVITSPEAQSNGLAISLFERLTEEGVVPSIMLNIQYRMHPAISHFPSIEFYNNALLDGTADTFGHVSPRLMPPSVSLALLPPSLRAIESMESKHAYADGENQVRTSARPPVIFLDHSGNESIKSRSRVNLNEAHIVASVVEDLLLNNDNLSGQDIGIIAPYVAQISLLTKLFNTDTDYRKRFIAVLGEHRAMQIPNIEIKTVDGFEGREKEVIIFSTVRNNSGGYIGFLADRRRLNVGLTRAKRGLFVIGSMNTLQKGKFGKMSGGAAGMEKIGKGAESWRRYMQYIGEQGIIVNLGPGDALANVLYGNFRAATGAAPVTAALTSSRA
ncbi:hypothetical protein D9757_002469 [Collybiopsis confluens]|uniref:Uncharacterized protein n=1 Tax=Collybiopsis confluens TaxID=2823264 RepID=A0A8H5HYD3_9AGAR|nr:hypothetical protein D9757_002469 [Collybiopsis confluens]